MLDSDRSRELSRLGLGLHLAGVAFVAAASVAGFVLLLQPLHASVGELGERQSLLQSTIEQSEGVRSRNEKLQQRLVDAELKLTDLRQRIPDRPGESDFLRQMTELAETAGIQIEDYRPGAVRERPRYHEMEVQLSARGEYKSICELLHKIGELPRLCRISRMSMTAPEKSPLCSIQMTVTIYFAPPKADAGGKSRG